MCIILYLTVLYFFQSKYEAFIIRYDYNSQVYKVYSKILKQGFFALQYVPDPVKKILRCKSFGVLKSEIVIRKLD